MSTRSNIAIELRNKNILSVYCHSDGYISGVGKTLFENYNDYAKALKLIDSGNISSLGSTLNETSFYFRDWGRKEDKQATKYNNEFCLMYDLTGSTMIEYLYLYKNFDWYVSKSKYIDKKILGKNAYDIGVAYWTNFKKVSSYKKELSEKNNGISEAKMIGQISGMLKNNFPNDTQIIQGSVMPTKKQVN